MRSTEIPTIIDPSATISYTSATISYTSATISYTSAIISYTSATGSIIVGILVCVRIGDVCVSCVVGMVDFKDCAESDSTDPEAL